MKKKHCKHFTISDNVFKMHLHKGHYVCKSSIAWQGVLNTIQPTFITQCFNTFQCHFTSMILKAGTIILFGVGIMNQDLHNFFC